MTVFTVVGLLVASGFLGWVALLGLICAVFNNIGGAGKTHEVVIGLAFFGACLWAIYELWSRYSPFTVVAVGGGA